MSTEQGNFMLALCLLRVHDAKKNLLALRVNRLSLRDYGDS